MLVVVGVHVSLDYLGVERAQKGIFEAVFAATLMLVPFFLLRKQIVKPLREMRETAYKIISGDLSARSNVKSPQELRELSETINAMVAKLTLLYEQLLAVNASLEQTVKERTRELTVEHEKLSAIFKGIPDGVIFLSVSGEVVEVNPMMEVIWGVNAADIKGKSVMELPDGAIKESLTEKCSGVSCKRCWEVHNCIEKNCPAYMSEDIRCWLVSGTYCRKGIQPSVKRKIEDVCSGCAYYKDVVERCGSSVEMELQGRHYKISNALVLGHDNKVIGEIKTFYDITEEKLLERRKADFISLVTHDLKSPLTSIIGYSDLLTAGLAGDDLDYANSIRTNGARLLDMVEQYLELTKMEAGMLRLDLKLLDPEDFIEEAVSGLRVQAMEKGIDLALEYDRKLRQVEADRQKMVRVITNLVSNGIKYTPAGGRVAVSSKSCTDTAGNDLLEITVSDNGYGMSHEDLPYIFDRYYRTKSAAGIKGSGLGLAVVKSLVDAHRGEVLVASSPGEGSTFTVRIPVKAA